MTREELKSRVFIGVVEDIEDPKKMGRCKVRVLNVFDSIPTEDLPWASCWKDLNGNTFILPEKGKVVSVVFDEGNPYKPEYIFAEHYNINLENKLQSLSGSDYTSMRALMFDNKTQIYSNDKEGLKIDYKYNNINITNESIDLNLKDNQGKISIGDANADQSAILGTNFLEWFDGFVDSLMSGPYIGNSGAPVIANPGLVQILAKYKAMKDPKFLSDNIFINSNHKISTVIGSKREDTSSNGDRFKSTSKNFKNSSNNDFKNSSNNGGAGIMGNSNDDFKPVVDPNDEANVKFDMNNSVPSSNPVYIGSGPNSGIMSDFAKEVVRIAISKVGVHEVPKNSNSGPEVIAFQRSTDNSGTGWAWCAAFVCYCFREASRVQGIKHSFSLPRTAGAFNFEAWARKNSKYIEIFHAPFSSIIPGDVVIFKFSHIGISVGEMKNGRVDTVEGNTDPAGSREGGGVFRKNRAVDGKSGILTVLRIKYNPNLVKK